MSNLQEVSNLENTVAISARRFEESPFIERTDSPKMVRGAPYGMEFSSTRALTVRRVEGGILGNLTDIDTTISPFEAGLARFTPSTDQIARARRVIAEFETADTGLLVIDGKLIEKPVLRNMYRIVAIAGRMGG